MTSIEPITAVLGTTTAPKIAQSTLMGAIAEPQAINFGQMLTSGIDQVEAKLKSADALVRQFAVDDSIPVHQVTIALEEARLAVELAVQVRNKVVEGYREIMNMQL
jgi:flagellar hook-basal body complex protein FliE